MKPIAFPALPALVALLLTPFAGAAEAGEDDLAWRMEPRDLDVRGHATGFTFTSDRETALGEDRISGSLDAPDARLTVALLTSQPEASSVRLDIAWTLLAEYRDADGDGRYGLADETLQSIAVRGLPQQTVVTPILAGGDAATVTYTLPANGTDDGPLIGGSNLPRPQGTLRLTFTLVSTTTTVADSQLRPTDLGLGAEVRDFPFQAGDSRLALVAHVSTDAAALEPTDRGVGAVSGRHSWLAAWAPEALADGRAVLAGWSSLASDADQATAVLSLPRGDTVSHDGAVSAHRSAAEVIEALRDLPPGDWRLYVVGLAGAALALGIPSLRRLKES